MKPRKRLILIEADKPIGFGKYKELSARDLIKHRRDYIQILLNTGDYELDDKLQSLWEQGEQCQNLN